GTRWLLHGVLPPVRTAPARRTGACRRPDGSRYGRSGPADRPKAAPRAAFAAVLSVCAIRALSVGRRLSGPPPVAVVRLREHAGQPTAAAVLTCWACVPSHPAGGRSCAGSHPVILGA